MGQKGPESSQSENQLAQQLFLRCTIVTGDAVVS